MFNITKEQFLNFINTKKDTSESQSSAAGSPLRK